MNDAIFWRSHCSLLADKWLAWFIHCNSWLTCFFSCMPKLWRQINPWLIYFFSCFIPLKDSPFHGECNATSNSILTKKVTYLVFFLDPSYVSNLSQLYSTVSSWISLLFSLQYLVSLPWTSIDCAGNVIACFPDLMNYFPSSLPANFPWIYSL